ncbi:MAG TPA: hypothetical protein PKX92_02850 [Edaphocola sp.]|nr:hypothetical protein [Edaphocola sp.]
MYKIIITAVAIILLASCGKKNKKQYSYWKVNGVEYSSNNVTAEEGYMKPVCYISCQEKNSFTISFSIGEFPKNGEYPLAYFYTQNPDYAGLGICFDTVCYLVTSNNTAKVRASEQNGKAQFKVDSVRMVNFKNPLDSIWVDGVFNEP